MPLNDDFKDRVKAAADIQAIAFDLGLQERGGRFFCPACQPTGGKTPDLVVKDGAFICHKCKAKGDVFALVQLAGSAGDFKSALKWVAGKVGLQQPRGRSNTTPKQQTLTSEKAPGKVSRPPEKSSPGASYEDIYSAFLGKCREVEKQPLAWLTREKHIASEVVKALGLRFCGHEYLAALEDLEARFGKDQVKASGLWSFYSYVKAKVGFIVIPYFRAGRPVYLKARPPMNKDLAESRGIDRFRNTAGKIPCLYNIDTLKTKPPKVYICEGESDTWAALTFGHAAVGSPGAGDFKPEWVEAFRDFQTPDGTSTVFLVPDQDRAGQEGARMVADLFLKAGLPCPQQVKIPSPFKDLGDYLRGNDGV
jgi:hypothetical protein